MKAEWSSRGEFYRVALTSHRERRGQQPELGDIALALTQAMASERSLTLTTRY